MEAKWNREMWHDQREKPNNLKLAQQTKALILNQLVDKTKARLPTFSHNLHLNIYSISLTFSDIHQKPTCRLFDSIQFCVASVLVAHRIFLWAPLLFLIIVVSQNVTLSVKTCLLPDKLLILMWPPKFGRFITLDLLKRVFFVELQCKDTYFRD